MLITDNTYTIQKSDSTNHINVHLQQDTEYVNIILPNDSILVIDAKTMSIYDESETLVKTIIIED